MGMVLHYEIEYQLQRRLVIILLFYIRPEYSNPILRGSPPQILIFPCRGDKTQQSALFPSNTDHSWLYAAFQLWQLIPHCFSEKHAHVPLDLSLSRVSFARREHREPMQARLPWICACCREGARAVMQNNVV